MNVLINSTFGQFNRKLNERGQGSFVFRLGDSIGSYISIFLDESRLFIAVYSRAVGRSENPG